MPENGGEPTISSAPIDLGGHCGHTAHSAGPSDKGRRWIHQPTISDVLNAAVIGIWIVDRFTGH
jgi:hypothetical protein